MILLKKLLGLTVFRFFYFNGFSVAQSNADVSLSMMLDNVDKLSLKTSYTTIKTLAFALMATIETFQKITNQKILTTEEVNEAMKDQQA